MASTQAAPLIVESHVISPGGDWFETVRREQRLKLMDLHECPVIDFLCYNAVDPTERYNAADTMKINGSLFIGKGTRLYSDMGNVLFSVVDDTCGRHDTIGGCSRFSKAVHR